MQHLSANGQAMIKSLEALAFTAYPDGLDSAGEKKYSIGYGHSGAQKGDTITKEQAEALFAADVPRYEQAVRDTIAPVVASDNQFDAMVSLAYNEGAAAFASSTLAKLFRAGNVAGASAEFARWIYSDGLVNPELVARRARERALFDTPPGSTLVAASLPVSLGRVLAGGTLIFFCPSCGARCAAHIGVDKVTV